MWKISRSLKTWSINPRYVIWHGAISSRTAIEIFSSRYRMLRRRDRSRSRTSNSNIRADVMLRQKCRLIVIDYLIGIFIAHPGHRKETNMWWHINRKNKLNSGRRNTVNAFNAVLNFPYFLTSINDAGIIKYWKSQFHARRENYVRSRYCDRSRKRIIKLRSFWYPTAINARLFVRELWRSVYTIFMSFTGGEMYACHTTGNIAAK